MAVTVEVPSNYHTHSAPLPVYGEGTAYRISFTRGLDLAEVEPNHWSIEPIMSQNSVSRSATMPREWAFKIVRQMGFREVAFTSLTVHQTILSSKFNPITPGQTNHMCSAADLWSSAASNIARPRFKRLDVEGVSKNDVDAVINSAGAVERKMRYISINLRNMDRAIRSLLEQYNEAKQRAMQSKSIGKIGLDIDWEFASHSQAFLAAFGAARDHYAALVAERNGWKTEWKKNKEKIDCLRDLLRVPNLDESQDSLALKLFSAGAVAKHETKFEAADWLSVGNKLRNQYIHNVPYGVSAEEQFGIVDIVSKELGVWSYRRPCLVGGVVHTDLLEVLLSVYRPALAFFYEAIRDSEYDTGMVTLTAEDILDLKIE